MKDRELIHFAGIWSEVDAALVKDVVHHFEMNEPVCSGLEGGDLPWLCSTYSLGDRMRREHVFVATRDNGLFIFAHSAEELAQKIRVLSSQSNQNLPIKAA